MAKQIGIIRLTGTIGGITFMDTRYGHVAKAKSGVSRERITHDPAFQCTRENNDELTLATKATSLLHNSMRILCDGAKDSDWQKRLMKLVCMVRNEDHASVRGQRTVAVAVETPGVATMFKGYEFNLSACLPNVLLHPLAVDMAAGTVVLENLDVAEQVCFPPAGTHVTLRCGWARVDFASGEYSLALSERVVLGRDAAAQPVVLSVAELPAGTGTLFCLMRVGFLQVVNGVEYVLSDGRFNVGCLVGVE